LNISSAVRQRRRLAARHANLFHPRIPEQARVATGNTPKYRRAVDAAD